MKINNLDDLAVFIRVKELNSFSAVAHLLNVSPATISKQIKRLEKALGTTLFERNTRRLKLTDEGKMIAVYARQALQLLEEASDVAVKGGESLSGMIRVTAPVNLGNTHVANVIAAFNQQYPHIGFELQTSDRIVDIYAEDIDVAVRVGELSDSRLIARRVASNRKILVASPAYIESHPRITSLQDLVLHTCLVFSYPSVKHNEWSLSCGDKVENVTINSHLFSDNGQVLRCWALAGLGIALRETWSVVDDIKQGKLVRVLPAWESPDRIIYIVRAKRDPVPKRIQAFMDFFVESWRQPPWER